MESFFSCLFPPQINIYLNQYLGCQYSVKLNLPNKSSFDNNCVPLKSSKLVIVMERSEQMIKTWTTCNEK